MKKMICAVLSICFMLSMAACGSGNDKKSDTSSVVSAASSETSSTTSSQEAASSNVSKDTLPEVTIPETKGVTFQISTPSGSSENGVVPVIFESKDDLETNGIVLGLYVCNFDGNKLTYIYVDGSLIDKDQLSCTDTSIAARENGITFGKHTVQAVQYDGKDQVCVYKTAQYEVKEK